jgi:hypothetical protein
MDVFDLIIGGCFGAFAFIAVKVMLRIHHRYKEEEEEDRTEEVLASEVRRMRGQLEELRSENAAISQTLRNSFTTTSTTDAADRTYYEIDARATMTIPLEEWHKRAKKEKKPVKKSTRRVIR